MIEKLRFNAELVVATAREKQDVELGYDEEGVEWLDEYIEGLRLELAPEKWSKLVSPLGSFLGECIIHTFGGEWAEKDGRWGVRFDERNAAYPLAKVRKQFENGAEGGDSVLGFFRTIGVVFKLPSRK